MHYNLNLADPLVIKCGGSILSNHSELTHLMEDLLQLKQQGFTKIILVHGGGPDINSLCAKFKINSTFHQGLRVTSAEVLSITQMTLLGKTNADLVHHLNQFNLPALGLSGHALKLLCAAFIDQAKLGYVGEITQVNTEFLNALFALDIMPVIAPLAVDEKGNTLNINADLAAAAIARAVGAQKLILLSDIDGYYKNYPDPTSLCSELTLGEVQELLNSSGTVTDGMRPKLQACALAVSSGVALAQIINGKSAHSLINAIKRPGLGTSICK